MDKEIKKLWLEALRSGKYKQGKRMLRSADDKFCCLGVLADVALNVEWNQPDLVIGDNRYLCSVYGVNKEFLGNFTGKIPTEFLHSAAQGELIQRNDAGKSFEQIANWIEKNL